MFTTMQGYAFATARLDNCHHFLPFSLILGMWYIAVRMMIFYMFTSECFIGLFAHLEYILMVFQCLNDTYLFIISFYLVIDIHYIFLSSKLPSCILGLCLVYFVVL